MIHAALSAMSCVSVYTIISFVKLRKRAALICIFVLRNEKSRVYVNINYFSLCLFHVATLFCAFLQHELRINREILITVVAV